MTLLFSVVITTHNRADLLRSCLKSLFQQTIDHNLFEIIVVDNCSTDNTKEVFESFRADENFHYYYEEQLGMNAARNLGLKEAKGEYVAYIDDDAKAAPNWLEVAARELESLDPKPDCLGGPIFPFYTSPKPEWFKDKYEVRRDWQSPRYLKDGESFSGSNMIWKRDTLELLKGFDTDYGVIGDTLRFGGETIVFSKIWNSFEKPLLYYSPNLLVYHWVPPQKMKIKYRLKRALANGQTMGRIETRNLTLNEKMHYFFHYSGWSVLDIGRAIIHIGRHRTFQNWEVEELGSMLIDLGKALAVIKILPKI